jgi:hypothetical protein
MMARMKRMKQMKMKRKNDVRTYTVEIGSTDGFAPVVVYQGCTGDPVSKHSQDIIVYTCNYCTSYSNPRSLRKFLRQL